MQGARLGTRPGQPSDNSFRSTQNAIIDVRTELYQPVDRGDPLFDPAAGNLVLPVPDGLQAVGGEIVEPALEVDLEKPVPGAEGEGE